MAQAQALWTGKWFSVPESSRRSAHSFMLAALPDGGLRYDNGGDVLILTHGGKPTPEPFQPEVSVLTRELTPTSFRYEKIVKGKTIERMEERLSVDGKQLIGRRVLVGNDGRERVREVFAVRLGSGDGLEGRWRQLPPPRPKDRSTTPSPTSPFWIISQNTAGVMTWTIPETGEVLEGTADGRSHPMDGALRGRTFTLETLSPRHLLWSFYENGHLVEYAEERLSADGNLWSDLVWKPGYPHEKDRFVYRRK